MSVALPKPDLSWLGQLSSALAPQQQSAGMPGQMTANGYFPPVPVSGQGQQSGAFLSQLASRLPQNQFSVNPMMPTNLRLGG